MIEDFLIASKYINSDHPRIIGLAKEIVHDLNTEREKAIALYNYVRDTFRYDPYEIDLREESLRASNMLDKTSGYCGEKACLLAALARTVNIPARLGFARVTNHIGTERLEKVLGTNELVFHGFTELYINNNWLKCTPAFNASLCDKLGVDPLEFNGVEDSILQEFDKCGEKYMEYTHSYGSFSDIPRSLMLKELRKYYPHIFEKKEHPVSDTYFLID